MTRVQAIILITQLLVLGNGGVESFEIHGLSRGMREELIQKQFAVAKHPAAKLSSFMYEASDGFLNDTGDYIVVVRDSGIVQVNFTSRNHASALNKNYVKNALDAFTSRYGTAAIDSTIHDTNHMLSGLRLEDFGHLGPPATVLRTIQWSKNGDKLQITEYEKYYNVSIHALSKE